MQVSHYPSQPGCVRQCLSHHAVPHLPPHTSGSVFSLRCGDTLAGRPADFVPLSWQTIISPSLKHDSVLVWREKGNVSFKDLYIADTFASFDQLRDTFDLPKSRFKISTGPGLDLWPNMIISSNP